MIKLTKIGLSLASVLLWHMASAQSDLYIGPTSSLSTFTNSSIAVFGNLINDAKGGLNHNGGGTVYLFRSSTQGTGNTRVMDGPQASVGTDNYNNSGSYVRVYNLVTDNTVGTAVPSGTLVNSTAGSGQIQIEQEVRVTNNHNFLNGMVWTPRGNWKHAFLHYENGATYTGVAANNSAGKHVDGYVAYTGTGNFMFPIGNGVTPRMSGLSAAAQGEYKSAYFQTNPQAGTTGLSGISAGPLTQTVNNISVVSSSEFWDVDGTGLSNIVLTSLNSAGNTSNWASDFAMYPFSSGYELTITGFDPWEDLGSSAQPAGFSVDGSFTTVVAVNPDLGGSNGNPFSAFTWAASNNSSLGIVDLNLNVLEVNCEALLRFTTKDESNMSHAEIFRKEGSSGFYKIGTVDLNGETTGNTSYTYVDEKVQVGVKYIYKVDVLDNIGRRSSSESQLFTAKCDDNVIWKLYPNPTTGQITIQSNYQEPITAIRVYDVLGQIVRTRDFKDPQNAGYFSTEMDLTELAQGMYHLSVYDETGKELRSFTLNLVR